MNRSFVRRAVIVTAAAGLLGVGTPLLAANAAAKDNTDASIGICSQGDFPTYAEIFAQNGQGGKFGGGKFAKFGGGKFGGGKFGGGKFGGGKFGGDGKFGGAKFG